MGFRVQGLEFILQGLGLRVEDFGHMVLYFRARGYGFRG